MTNEPDPHLRDNALLDAVLGDEAWTRANTAAKSAALAEFRTKQNRRTLRFRLAQAAAFLLLASSIAWWWRQTPTTNTSYKVASANPVTSPSPAAPTHAIPLNLPTAQEAKPDPHEISEAQMLALFPKGSCTIAEIDGKRELIFFDHKIEQEGAIYQPGS